MPLPEPLRQAAKVVAAGADLWRRPHPGVVVLIYHQVGGGSDRQLDVPGDLFAAQMGELADAGVVVSLEDALGELRGPDDGRTRIVLTFDDGTADFVEHALPVLAMHRLPVTMYVATAYVEGNTPFSYGAPPLSWSALADACSTGLVSVGSHTHSHALLDRVDPRTAADELDRSIELIGDRLGTAALDFAYPKARAGSAVVASEVRSRFRSAALAGTRANRPGSTDPYRLARSPIQAGDRMRWFRRKLGGGMAFEDGLRDALDRRRHAGRSS